MKTIARELSSEECVGFQDAEIGVRSFQVLKVLDVMLNTRRVLKCIEHFILMLYLHNYLISSRDDARCWPVLMMSCS